MFQTGYLNVEYNENSSVPYKLTIFLKELKDNKKTVIRHLPV